MVAAADPRIAGVALLAAPAWTGQRIMEYQLRFAAEREVRTVSYTSADLVEAYLARDARSRAATKQTLIALVQLAMRQLRSGAQAQG